MASLVETAVETYIRAAGERDAAVRARLLAACFTDDARLVARARVYRGRAAIDAMIEGVLADPELVGFRLASVVDAVGTTFRYRSFVERRDGTTLEFFDAGEIDADGRITTILLFAGPLADA